MVDSNCAHYLATKLPRAEKDIVEGMGHTGLARDKFDGYLAKLSDLALGVPAQESNS